MSETATEGKTSTYYVSPTFIVTDGKVSDSQFAYFDEKGVKIDDPNAQNMRADKQGGNSDFVGFAMRDATFKSSDTHRYAAVLYSAVAQTLDRPELVSNFIQSADSKRLLIPIYKDTIRGVILVFQIFRDEQLIQLVGSPDPEIGNSTNGEEPRIE